MAASCWQLLQAHISRWKHFKLWRAYFFTEFDLSYRRQAIVNNDSSDIQYIPRNMHTVFALLCLVVVIHWLIFPYPSGLLHWHCGNITIAPVPAKQPWWIWMNTSCEFIMNDCITTTKQSTTKPCAYFLGYTVHAPKPRYPHSVIPLETSIWMFYLDVMSGIQKGNKLG